MTEEEIKKTWMVIVNPSAGTRKGLTDWPVISNQMYRSGLDFTCVFTEKKYHAVELTVKAINDGFRKIVAIGGDGTVNEIVNGIFIQKKAPVTDISLAVIAVGTGNDWVRMLGIPKTYQEAIKAISQGQTILQDVGLISFYETKVKHQRYMANVAGMGYDAAVNRVFNRLKDEGRSGKWLYILSVAKTLLGYRSKKFNIIVDGETILSNVNVFSANVGIGKYNGGGMLQLPQAEIDDGLFDITVIKKMSKLKIIKHFKKLFNGKIYKLPGVVSLQGKRIEINSKPETPIEIDGEALGYCPFVFELIPQCINVVVGKNYKK
ncbi:MAG: diacylglycerol kinase family lipid kinase [Prevotellaceae bacterium]|jgi:YegS/Rv2252/BmrU family lipid kinase|nr:diacylglycerol kinase family lipid kinase [Prevotellaceae bacterium]